MALVPDELLQLIEKELLQPVPAGAQTLTERIRERFGTSVRAVLLYGSCLRTGDDQHSLLDLYVFVDSYHRTYDSTMMTLSNRLLPPNVFYIEAAIDGHLICAKYAVVELGDLRRLTSKRTFEPYFWARFAQPCALVYAADDAARREVATALAGAVITFVRRGVPLAEPRFDSRGLWVTALRATYQAELRAERPHAAEGLYDNAPDRYAAITPLALSALPSLAAVEEKGDPSYFTVRLGTRARRQAALVWRLRRLHGKGRFLLRILRNALIFDGAVEYAMWKIHRHTGVEINREWRNKPYPLLALGAEAWRLYRAGAFR